MPDVTNYIWLRTSSTNDNFNGDCDFARVDMSQALCAKILALHGELVRMRESHPEMNILELCAYDYEAQWVSFGFDGADEISEQLDKGPDFVIEREVSAQGFPVDEKWFQRSECDRLVVTEYCIYWKCYPKHSDPVIESGTVTIKDIQDFKNGLIDALAKL